MQNEQICACAKDYVPKDRQATERKGLINMERRIFGCQITAFDEYLQREEKSAITIEKYLRDVYRFAEFADGREITKELVIAYKQSLEEKNYAVRSMNSMLASVNCFLRFSGWEDCKVKSLRCQRQIYCAEEKELTKEEYVRLLRASEKKQQLNLIIQTICSTGIRVSELQYFTVEAICRGEVRVKCKNKIRIVLVPGKLRKKLNAYAKSRRISSGTIFVTKSGRPVDRSNIWAQMKRLCENARVNPEKVFPHNLRKLFARTFYRIEKDIAKLADILGHGSIETTRIYIMTTGVEHRRKIEKMELVI